MNRQDLEQLRGLVCELKSLNTQMLKPKPTMQVIEYKDYKTGKGIPKVDMGLDCGEAELERLEKLYNKKLNETVEKILDIEEWMKCVEDLEMRSILRWYYKDGLSQQEIGGRLEYSQQAVAKKLKCFWLHTESK